jgi:hypothetical protein
MLYLAGFTVDDALVTARVAHHVATGQGYRFNPGGPVVDAVTPLGWVFLLVPFATHDVLGALRAAQWMGAIAWGLAAAWLGYRLGVMVRLRTLCLVGLALACHAPIAAWAVAGMETGVVTALATLALVESRWALLWAGAAAAWRPELLPWAATLGVGSVLARTRSPRPAVVALLAVTLPSLVVGVVRLGVFGSVAPLSVIAKPSDVAHGLYYGLAALVHTGLPLLVCAPWAWRRLSGHHAAVLVAFAAHLVAVVLVGGDWMALFRLMVPVLPSLLLVGAAIAEQASPWASLLRLVLAVLVSSRLMLVQGPHAREVGEERWRVIAELGPVLSQARRVAALDVGWVGAATRAEIVDLAGITDPSVALLPGGHTTKRLPPGFLRSRRVDRLVLLYPRSGEPSGGVSGAGMGGTPRAWVERVVLDQAEEIGCDLEATAQLGRTGRYAVLHLKNEPW